MSKITKKELQRAIQRQESRIDGLVGLLAKRGYYDKEPEPQLKQLDQSVFNNMHERWKFAAIDADGSAHRFNKLVDVFRGEFVYEGDDHSEFKFSLIGKGYDASNWQNSLIEREPGPQLKQLDQSAFDHPYATDRFKYVALNADGQAVFFESKPVISNCLDIWVVHTGSVMPMLKGYNASNWQNSLIERSTAKESLKVDLSSEPTGSDYYYSKLVRERLKNGQGLVMCFVSNVSESDAMQERRVGVIAGVDTEFNDTNGYGWQYAIPINNRGEPLTASEVGL